MSSRTSVLSLRIILFCALASYTLPVTVMAEAKQNQAPLIRPSNLLEDVRGRKKRQPNISSKELAEIANKLLEEKGFDYDFDVCAVFDRDLLKKILRMSPSSVTYSARMAQTVGSKITLRFISEHPAEGLCGECSSAIPSLQVTKQEMLVASSGQRYQLKRPAAFYLDEAELVDETMRKVLRTWQMPFQTVPVGISPEGTKLYLEFWADYELDELVLELSENGRTQFRVRSDVDLQREGEWIENHPKDPKNAYLSFKRFCPGGKTYIIKFSAPCT